jgi:hypothetical protein
MAQSGARLGSPGALRQQRERKISALSARWKFSDNNVLAYVHWLMAPEVVARASGRAGGRDGEREEGKNDHSRTDA